MATYQTETQTTPLAWIQNIGHVLIKWKWTALSVALVIFFGATLFAFLTPPTYQANGRIWIENQPNILPFQDVLQFDNTDRSYVLSHYQLLHSRAIAIQTIDTLKLYENPSFMKALVNPKKPFNPSDPVLREKMIALLLKKVVVTPIQDTRLVEVKFEDRSPKFAADTLNGLFDAYIDLIVRQRYQATEQASEFLNTQITSLRTEIQESERKLNEYGNEKDIVPLSATETPTITKLAEINKALTDATIERIKAYQNYSQIKSATLGDIPEALNNPLIQRLREQYATSQRDYARKLITLKPESPEMQRLKSDLDATKEALQNETNNLISGSFSSYQAALGKEQSLQRLLDSQKSDAFKNSSNSIIYNSLKVEIVSKKTLLESLMKRQSETDMSSRLKGLKSSNVWIVDRADFPIQPAFPKKIRVMLIGLLFGLVGGAGLTLLIEFVGDTVRTSKDITNHTGLPMLGSVPSFEVETKSTTPRAEFLRLLDLMQKNNGADGKAPTGFKGRLAKWLGSKGEPAKPAAGTSQGPIELIASREPDSIQAESYRSIRTTLLVSSPPGKVKTILFTSPLAREGKSATVSNLGVALAQANKRVVIVDSDLRRPKQAKIFDISKGSGLTHFLSSNIDRVEVVKPTPFPNLFIVNAGPLPVNPIELLSSEKMDDFVAFLKRSFDYVLFDAPPILVVSDAIAMGPIIDGVILVARGGRTPIQALRQAKQKLDAHKLKCLGVILNSVDLIEQDGYYARQYYQYYRT